MLLIYNKIQPLIINHLVMKNKTSYIPLALTFIGLANICGWCDEEKPKPPTGSFACPAKNSCYLPGDKLSIRVYAYDDDGSVTSVEILLNGTSLTTMNTSPYEYTYLVGDIQEGEYQLKGVATDDDGETGSWELPITVLPEPETFTDSRDGNVYRYVTIGEQDWMIDNLAWLPSVSPSTEISDNEAICYVSEYEGTNVSEAKATENYSTYGALYNWTAANSCCPEGWHLPSTEEWVELENYINTNNGSFDKTTYIEWGYVWWDLGTHLLHTSGWANEKNGLNTYGFSALPGGGIYYEPLPMDCPGVTASCKCFGDYWSATLTEGMGSAWGFWSDYPGNMGIHDGSYPKGYGISVRCIKDNQ
jgi:uncharacterized protein (TIGR02145 family)